MNFKNLAYCLIIVLIVPQIYSQQVDIPNINLINGYIGVAPWGTNSFWNGGVDDVMVWNRALNQQEIYYLYIHYRLFL